MKTKSILTFIILPTLYHVIEKLVSHRTVRLLNRISLFPYKVLPVCVLDLFMCNKFLPDCPFLRRNHI